MFERVRDVLIVVVGVGCVWLGWRALFLSPRPPEPARGPAWLARAWGAGHVLMGISLTVMVMTQVAGGTPDWPMRVILWCAGPLVVGTALAGLVTRWRGAAGNGPPWVKGRGRNTSIRRRMVLPGPAEPEDE